MAISSRTELISQLKTKISNAHQLAKRLLDVRNLRGDLYVKASRLVDSLKSINVYKLRDEKEFTLVTRLIDNFENEIKQEKIQFQSQATASSSFETKVMQTSQFSSATLVYLTNNDLSAFAWFMIF